MPIDYCDQSAWDKAGHRLYVVCMSGTFEVPVSLSPFKLGEPRRLFSKGRAHFMWLYSSTRDQFLTIKQTNLRNTAIVAFNWFEELDRMMAGSAR